MFSIVFVPAGTLKRRQRLHADRGPHLRWLSKLSSTADEAVKIVKSGDTLMTAGFRLCGAPNTLIQGWWPLMALVE